MTAIRIPNTDEIIFVNDHIGDIVIDMSNYPQVDAAIRQEDVPVIGDWEDYTGSATKTQVLLQGIEDVNPATLRGQILESDPDRIDRGRESSTYRQRDKLVYIDLSKNGRI